MQLVRRHWSWFLVVATVGLMALTLLIPDGWLRTTIFIVIALGFLIAVRLFASRFEERA